ASGTAPITYQWSRNGQPIVGATAAALSLSNLSPADVGAYTVAVTNALGTTTTAPVTLSGTNAAPTITTHPSALDATVGQPAVFTVVATGSGPLSYQWRRHGFAVPGATAASFAISTTELADAHSYDVVVFDGLASTTSMAATLRVAPTIYPQKLEVDATFDLPAEINGASATAIMPYPGGKILVGGDFVRINGNVARRLARFDSNGALDTSFAPAFSLHTFNALAVQPDGKILAGGQFYTVNGATRNNLVRLLADGTLDPTFNPTGFGPSNTVNTIVLQADGKILIGGSFANYNATPRTGLARLNADGTLDASFNPALSGSSGTTDMVKAIALQADGKIVVGGNLTTVNGTARARLARLNSDGTLDTAFAI
ncbi:MAG: hypothetical protein Q8M65_07985, partial [Rhodoglobus sp.]|nr:hypothetical protein [Rhodoglobus sp.]